MSADLNLWNYPEEVAETSAIGYTRPLTPVLQKTPSATNHADYTDLLKGMEKLSIPSRPASKATDTNLQTSTPLLAKLTSVVPTQFNINPLDSGDHEIWKTLWHMKTDRDLTFGVPPYGTLLAAAGVNAYAILIYDLEVGNHMREIAKRIQMKAPIKPSAKAQSVIEIDHGQSMAGAYEEATAGLSFSTIGSFLVRHKIAGCLDLWHISGTRIYSGKQIDAVWRHVL